MIEAVEKGIGADIQAAATPRIGDRWRYPGPRSFADDPVDEKLFFGRGPEVEDLL